MSFEETISAECTTKTISIFAAISVCYKTTYNNNSHLLYFRCIGLSSQKSNFFISTISSTYITAPNVFECHCPVRGEGRINGTNSKTPASPPSSGEFYLGFLNKFKKYSIIYP